VFISPDGNGKYQIHQYLQKVKEFCGKLRNSSLSQLAQWKAVESIVEPSIMYPLVNTLYSSSDIQPIESINSQLQCSALGFNIHFPHALLYGPLSLGGLGLPSPTYKNTRHRINYFLFIIRCQTAAGQKFEISLIYTQLEIGTFQQFLSTPYHQFGHLATISMVAQIWRETEPLGIHLKPPSNATWIPDPLHPCDLSIMDLATSIYDKKGSTIINRCRIYLQIISICDLLLFDSTSIHPDFLNGNRPPSRTSNILWPNFPRPPSKFWQLWGHFINHHVLPRVQQIPTNWFVRVNLRHHTPYFKHNMSPHLYLLNDGELMTFKLNKSPRSRLKATYITVPYQCELSFNQSDFIPVDIHVNNRGISVLGKFPTFHQDTSTSSSSFKEVIVSLPPSLKRICGCITLPPDDGAKLISSIETSNKTIIACSDASLKNNRAAHAWIISTGDINDITDPFMHISGSGPVDRLPQFLSLVRADLTGLTALTIILKLYREFYISRAKVNILCDNQGMLKKCEHIPFHRLRFHREKNVDLLLSHRQFSSNVPVTYSWGRGHADKVPWDSIEDLQYQQLSWDEIYNIWVDKMANVEWSTGCPSSTSPGVTPAKKWAVYAIYPEYHKIAGNLSTCLSDVLGYEQTARYIFQNHNFSAAKLKHVNTSSLESFLRQQKIFRRANIIKLMHGWIPTMASLSRQGRVSSPLCPLNIFINVRLPRYAYTDSNCSQTSFNNSVRSLPQINHHHIPL